MNKFSYLSLIAVSAAFVGCNDFDYGVTADTFKQKEYAENFEKAFGTIDPQQNWSMASRFTANVDLGSEINGELKLYTDAPGLPGSKYLGRVVVVDGIATMDFDAERGSSLFYACVKNQQGRTLSTGYYLAKENILTIAESARSITRAASSVTRGSQVNLHVERIRPEAIVDFKSYYPDTYKNYDEMCKNLKVDGYAKWDQDNNENGHDNSLMFKLATSEQTLVPNLYRLNNVDFSQHDAGYTAKFLRQIFGNYTNKDGVSKEGVYKEGIDHVALMHHGTFNVEPDVVYTVGEGGGEVILDCIWRGTQATYDFFGYYYYTGELTTEQLWNIDKYILIDEKTANTGMWIGGESTNRLIEGKTAQHKYNSVTGQNDILWYNDEWEATTGMSPATYMNNQEDNLLRGTKIKLTYFGGATPSYTFPEGTKIGFFMGWNQDTESDLTPSHNRILFSDCAKTYELFRRTYTPNDANKSSMTTDLLPDSFTDAHTKNRSGAYEGPDVRQFASTFKFGDITVMGFGDEVAGDKDLNDICFFVSGNIDEPEDNTPDDLPEPETQSWVMACEDLGGTFDYDFNDVVFSVAHATNEAKAKITALAAGGTLPVELTYNGNVLTGPNGGTHFNSWFGTGNLADEVAINAGKNTTNATGKSIEIEVPLDFSVANTESSGKMGGFALNVYGGANGEDYTTITAPEDGDAPQMMCLPSNWVWPKENDRITDAYPKFGEWGENYNVTNWYMHYDVDFLFKEPDYESIAESDVSEIGGVTPGGGGNSFVLLSTNQYTTTKEGFGEADYTIPSEKFEGDKAVVEYVITGGPQFSCTMGGKGRVTEDGSFEITGDNMTTAKESGVPFTIHYYGQTSCSVSFTIKNYKKG